LTRLQANHIAFDIPSSSLERTLRVFSAEKSCDICRKSVLETPISRAKETLRVFPQIDVEDVYLFQKQVSPLRGD
jgi:hypothetical protein